MTNLLKPSAMFVLKTYDLPAATAVPSTAGVANPSNTWTTSTNSIGSVLSGRSSMTWTNVDLKTICGTMWEQYDYFTLTLVTVVAAAVVTLSTTIIDRSAIVNVGGLQWVNSSYTIGSKVNTGIVQMGTLNLSVINTGSLTQNNFMSGVMFAKADRMVNLTITLNHALDGLLLNSITVQNTSEAVSINPQQMYQFRIDGVDYKQ